MFDRLPNPGSDEVVGLFPETSSGGRNGAPGNSWVLAEVSRNDVGYSIDRSDGSAARFFYAAKASRSERGEGNNHPTVKPLALMRYLCRLTKTPTGGRVLDMFMGSGTTLLAAAMEGREAVGIEIDEATCEIAVERLERLLDSLERESVQLELEYVT